MRSKQNIGFTASGMQWRSYLKKSFILITLWTVFCITTHAAPPAFVEITKPIIKIHQKPEPDSKVTFTTSQAVIFQVLSENENYYEVSLLDKGSGWILKTNTKPFDGSNPPVARIALINDASFFASTTPTPSVSTPTTITAIPTATTTVKPRANPKQPISLSEFRYPKIPSNLNLDINGYYEGKVSMRNYNPKVVTDPRWETIRQDPIFNKLPRDVLVGDPKFDLRYKFNIDGQLDNNLRIHYDIEQEPDFPGKYDIRINYDRSELTFFHFDSEFKNGEFINVKKALDGVKGKTETDTWSAQFATGRQRSDPQILQTNGNGQNKLKLQNRSILEGSVVVYLNNNRIQENRDYKINYFEGEITFTNPPQLNDFIKVIYEFTNPIEDYIPALSRKNFTAAQFNWHEPTLATDIKEVRENTQTLWPSKIDPSQADNTLEFQLENNPVVLGSEIVYLNERKLIRNKDYFIRSLKGKIVIQNITLTDRDQLKITYSSYINSAYSEDLIGNDSPGPYQLAHPAVIANSVKVSVNDTAVTEGLDYTINYDLGKILFAYKVPYPKIISVEYNAIKTHLSTVTENRQNAPLSVGLAYLNESTQSQDDNLVLTQTETVPISGSTIYVSKTPVIASGDILVKSGTTTLNYTVSNAYTGAITLLTAPSTTTAQVTYTYKKSFSTTFTFTGDQRANQPYFASDILLRDLPMKYNGLGEIRVFGPVGTIQNGPNEFIRLRPNIEYRVVYDENSSAPGIDIQLQFLTTIDNIESRLPAYPNDRNTITLFYEYAPNGSPDAGKINQTMIGATVKAKITPEWAAEAELTGTQHNFSRAQVDATANIQGNGVVNFAYPIGKTDIVQNSESIVIGTIQLTRDVDYFINYATGTLRFKNLTPRSQDTIQLKFKYFDNKQTVEAGDNKAFKFATRIATSYKTDSLTLKADYKNIDKDFLAISPINDPGGSQIYSGQADWIVNDLTKFNIKYQSKNTLTSPKNSEKVTRLHQDETNATSEFRLFEIFDNKITTRYLTEVEDKKEGATTHDTDKRTIAINLATDFGPDYFRNSLVYGQSSQENDYLDKLNLIQSTAQNLGAKSRLVLSKLPFLGDVVFGPEYARNQSDLSSNTSKEINVQNIYGTSIEVRPIETLRTSVGYQLQTIDYTKQTITNNIVTSENITKTEIENRQISAEYTPFSWFDTGYSFQQKESQSPLLGQTGEQTKNTNFRIKSFSPYGLLTSVFGNNVLLGDTIRNAFFTYSTTLGNTKQNNGLQVKTDQSNAYSFNNFQPIPGLYMKRTGYDTQSSFSQSAINSTTTSENRYSREYNQLSTDVAVNLDLPLFNLFEYQFGLTSKQEDRITQQIANATGVTSSMTTESLPEYTRTQRVNLKLPTLLKPLQDFTRIDIGKITLSLSETIANKENIKLTKNTKTNAVMENFNDSSHITTYQADNTYSPFNLFDTSTNFLYQDEVYNRNQNTSQKGSIFKNTIGGKSSAGFKLLSNLTFSPGYERYRINQFSASTINITKDTISDSLNQVSTPSGNMQLLNNNEVISGTLILTPIAQWDLKVGAGQQVIDETITTKNQSLTKITQTSLIIGTGIRPLDGLTISSEAQLKSTELNTVKQGSGYSIVGAASYLPIQAKNFTVKVDYDVKFTKGIDINTLSKEAAKRGSGASIQTKVSEQDNVVHNGSVNINILFPITNTPYIRSVVITGEGYIKRIEDRKTSKNNYDITGLMIKGTINF